MSIEERFKDSTFKISDNDARLRDPNDIMEFLQYAATDALPPGAAVGDFKKIPKGVTVSVDQIRIEETGSKRKMVFALAKSPDGGTIHGWTSTRNFDGKFVNVTLGLLKPPSGSGKYGPNAAWSGGTYLGQLDLVRIVDNKLEIENIAYNTVGPYFKLVDAAAKNGILITINSGFRSYQEQKYLHDGYEKHLPNFNLAAKPGFSKHQNGIAFDIPVAGGDGNPTYEWLKKHATGFGFLRTVNKEPWHWEYDPTKAATAKAHGTFKTTNVIK